MIEFEDLKLIFYIWVFNIKIKVVMGKNSNLNNIFLLLLGLWLYIYGFNILKHYFGSFTMLCTHVPKIKYINSSSNLNFEALYYARIVEKHYTRIRNK